MSRYEYIDVTSYVVSKYEVQGKIRQYFWQDRPIDEPDGLNSFYEEHRRMDRNAKEGFERKVFAKLDTKTNLIVKNKDDMADGSWGNLIRERTIRLYYLKNNDKYCLLREPREHCVESAAKIWSAQEEHMPMTATKRNGVFVKDPIRPAVPEDHQYWLFGVQYTKDDWERHPFKIKYKLNNILEI